jgi:hypothetical protein
MGAHDYENDFFGSIPLSFSWHKNAQLQKQQE